MAPIDYTSAAEITEHLEDHLVKSLTGETNVNRRTVIGGLAVAGSAAIGLGSARTSAHPGHQDEDKHGTFGAVDEYRDLRFDPHEFRSTFNTGADGQDNVEQEIYEENGTTVRHYQFTAVDTPIEIVPGIEFEAWAFNGQVPGPTIRAVEGDIIRITFTNFSRHAHTIHPHLKNFDPAMDGVPQNGPGVLDAGESFTYEWQAKPAGVHFYHCHSMPLKEHIHRGLYGAIIVDPDPERVRENPHDYVTHLGSIDDEHRERLIARARRQNHEYPENEEVEEHVIVMNSFDTDFDGENEVYAANTRAFAYGIGETNGKGNWAPGETKRPIQIDKDKTQLVYLINVTEFDPINSLHTHSQFFDYYNHGTMLQPSEKNIDTIMQCQAERGILEIDYADHEPGLYMFHAHQSEFAELGWMSFFEVV